MKLSKIFKKGNKEIFKCNCCGIEFDEVPNCFGSEYPEYFYSIPENEIKGRVELEKSLCVIDKKHFFHRGRLTIPIIDFHKDLYFDIWTSISAENFSVRMDSWEKENRNEFGPYFGWIQNQIPTYEDTINIKSISIEQSVGTIPEIEVTEVNHPLRIDQQNGISYEKAIQIIQYILKEDHTSE